MDGMEECKESTPLLYSMAKEEVTPVRNIASPLPDEIVCRDTVSSPDPGLPVIQVEVENQLYVVQNRTDVKDGRAMLENSTSNLQCLMHLLKGNIGTGILAMPIAVKHAGLWVGFVGLLVIGVIAIHCMHLLVKCSHVLCKKTSSVSLDYAEVMETSLKLGPMKLRRFSRVGRILINALLLITQFGFCSIYIVFIATSLKQVIHSFHPGDPDIRVYMIITTALLIPYTFVKNLKSLAPFSAFANVLTFLGLGITISYTVRGLPDESVRPAFASWSTLPLYFGTAIFAYEGISLVLPLENKMRNPSDFGGLSGVLNLGMVTVTCLYTALGFYGYLKFGDTVSGSITLNLPNNDWLYLSVKLMYAIAIFISYGVQFYVIMKIIWPVIENKLMSRRHIIYGEYVLRIIFVLVQCGFAVLIPHLDLLISLIGAFASASLALVFPPLIELATYSAEDEYLSKWTIIKNILIICLGFLGFITGTYSSMVEIITSF